jgi:hypothetical protein
MQTKEITVDFVDECWDAQLGTPLLNPNYLEMELYTYSTADISRVSPTLNCPFTYEFIPLGDGPSPLTINKPDFLVEMRPESYSNHMGLHEYVVKACIQVEGTLANCATSAVASVLVSDPCADSYPITHPIDTQMSASRFTTNYISLPSDVVEWPFLDSVDQSSSYLNPDSGKCGSIKYVVLNESQEPSTFVEFKDGVDIVMSPTLDTPAENGIHLMYLRAYMDAYPDNYYDVPFYVTVTACEPIIDASNVMIPNFFHTWGAPAQVLPTDQAFKEYTWSPPCDVAFSFDIV